MGQSSSKSPGGSQTGGKSEFRNTLRKKMSLRKTSDSSKPGSSTIPAPPATLNAEPLSVALTETTQTDSAKGLDTATTPRSIVPASPTDPVGINRSTSSLLTGEELAAKLRQRLRTCIEKHPDDQVGAWLAFLHYVRQDGIVPRAAKAGHKAFNFELYNQFEQKVTLTELLAKGPLAIIFVRGAWGEEYTSQMNQALPHFKRLNANLVAIATEPLNLPNVKSFEISVLTDTKKSVAKEFGLVFENVELLKRLYMEEFKTDKSPSVDDITVEINPTYTIDPDGVISYALVDGELKKATTIQLINLMGWQL